MAERDPARDDEGRFARDAEAAPIALDPSFAAPLSVPPVTAPGPVPVDAATRQLFERVARGLAVEGPRLPRATYRVQLNRDMPFRKARELVDYLDTLGISDLYVSPFFKARPESTHGYDVVDHGEFNPSIGNREDFDALSDELRAHGMGLLLDTVPNHMGIGEGPNQWWMDVLENGPSSLYADYFDIDWHPLKSDLENRVLLPILGDHYGKVLERGELRIRFEGGGFFLGYFDWKLPVNPRTYHDILETMLPSLIVELGEDHDAVLELQSIITGLGHLPPRSENRRAKMIERRREKEILKRRLAMLVSEQPALAKALDDALVRVNGQAGEPRSFDALDRLLEWQAYRLSFFRVAAEEINYRRFFDVNDLAAIRMENAEVFVEAHRLSFALISEGRITGLRVDHPDGLWDPGAYLTHLQHGYFLALCARDLARSAREGDGPDDKAQREALERMRPGLDELWRRAQQAGGPLVRPLYLVVEKILARAEPLPEDWPIWGTVGYEFGALAGGLFVDRDHEVALTELYRRATDSRIRFDQLVYEKKRLTLQSALASELNVLVHAVTRIAMRNRASRDFTRGTLTYALREVIAWFPVYRTYVNERSASVSLRDRQAVERALRLARRRSPTTDPSVYDFLRELLLLEGISALDAEEQKLRRDFVMKLQQLTGPVMAKGVEDTAFYIYHRLDSLNEVGGEPERFGTTVVAFHQANEERLATWPYSLLTTSTHDTKRSEDVRARISVLSEIPDEWEAALARFREATAGARADIEGESAPDANEEYLFYQTLLGTFPSRMPGPPQLAEYTERIVAYMSKAMKEAKVNTSWINPNPDHDAAVEQFVRSALAPGSLFLERLVELGARVAFHGMWGSLSQLLLKLTSPGVPDFYQGNELWDFSVVDSENPRPVDFRLRKELLGDVITRKREGRGYLRELLERAEDGRIKMLVTHVGLQARRDYPELFRPSVQRGAPGVEVHGAGEAGYLPLEAEVSVEGGAQRGTEGPASSHLVAFARRGGGNELVVIAPRLSARLAAGRRLPPVGALWKNTVLPVRGERYLDLFSGEPVAALRSEGRLLLPLSLALADFPVGLLLRID